MFDGTLGTWKTDPVNFELIENVKPIFSQSYLEPKVHKELFKKEVDHLFLKLVPEISTIQNGDPHRLYNLNLNQIRYILYVTLCLLKKIEKHTKYQKLMKFYWNRILFIMFRHLIYQWDIIISNLSKTQVIYVWLFSLEEIIVKNVYQSELLIPRLFSNRRWMIYLTN